MTKEQSNDNNEDFWDKSNRPTIEYVSFEEVGDRVKGTYVGKRISINPYSEDKQEDYILDTEDGYKMVAGRAPLHKDNPDKEFRNVIYDMLDIPVGGVVGLIFDREEEKKKGTAKIIEARYQGEKNLEAVDKFEEMFDMEGSDDTVELDEDDVERNSEAPQKDSEEMPEF